jgi:hypothetical protein
MVSQVGGVELSCLCLLVWEVIGDSASLVTAVVYRDGLQRREAVSSQCSWRLCGSGLFMEGLLGGC